MWQFPNKEEKGRDPNFLVNFITLYNRCEKSTRHFKVMPFR